MWMIMWNWNFVGFYVKVWKILHKIGLWYSTWQVHMVRGVPNAGSLKFTPKCCRNFENSIWGKKGIKNKKFRVGSETRVPKGKLNKENLRGG